MNPCIEQQKRSITFPLWYYGRPRKSDRKFIEDRLSVVPEKFKQRVCDKYDKLYRSLKTGNRKAANVYLHRVAVYFRRKVNAKRYN
jgi:hypothetical protein